MPIYEYHCKDCEKDFEYLVFKLLEVTDCPCCKSTNVDKLMSSSVFVSKSCGANGKSVKTSASSSSCEGCVGSSCGTCGS